MADVEMPIDGEHIGFFAVDRSEARGLRAKVEAFYGPLASQGYRLTLSDVN